MGEHDGKVALITGAASGIGRAAARLFAAAGAKVMCGDIDLAGARETAGAIGDDAAAIELDVAEEATGCPHRTRPSLSRASWASRTRASRRRWIARVHTLRLMSDAAMPQDGVDDRGTHPSLLEIPVMDIRKTKVLRTVLLGNTVFERKQRSRPVAPRIG